MSVDPNYLVQFEKSIIVSHSETQEEQTIGSFNNGQIRFNKTTNTFEGYTGDSNPDIFGNKWRPLIENVASASNLGVIRVGTNLNINPTTGILSSIAAGISKFNQLVITVSPYPGAADYQSINVAIADAIGTPAGNYMDGILTIKLSSPPSAQYPFVIQLGPGQYTEYPNQIILPDYVSLRGEDNYNSVINLNVGSAAISTSALITAGNAAVISKLVLNINDLLNSNYASGLYFNNASNVVIDSVIVQTADTHNTILSTTGLYMNGGVNNQIINSQFLLNCSQCAGNTCGLNITNSQLSIQNNKIIINTPNTTQNYGIILNNINSLDTISDSLIINNLVAWNTCK